MVAPPSHLRRLTYTHLSVLNTFEALQYTTYLSVSQKSSKLIKYNMPYRLDGFDVLQPYLWSNSVFA
jgi:hypothetical protein